jgi:hypothetical protein
MASSETVAGIIGSIHEHRAKFERFCRSLSEEELSRPVPDSTWVVKDFVSHLATLDPELARAFEATAAGRPEDAGRNADGSPFDLDGYNDAQVAERRDWPLERILEEAAGNRAALIETLERLSDEDIAQMMHFQGDAKRSPAQLPLKVFLLGWSLHDPIHVADMLKALPERAGDAELAAWLSHPVIQGYQQAMAGPARR